MGAAGVGAGMDICVRVDVLVVGLKMFVNLFNMVE